MANTQITIGGEKTASVKLLNAIKTADCVECKEEFGEFVLVFKTKAAAKKALATAYKSFCKEMPHLNDRLDGYTYEPGMHLNFVSGRARMAW